jgi:glycosyltransferase involved in cell wall biosynthesis
VPHLVKRFYPWSDYIIGNSSGVANDLVQVIGLPSDRIRVLYNPVITPKVREKARAPVNHPWFESGDPILLAVGRFTKQKDFPTLIRSFAKVHRNRQARLFILGEGPNRPELEALVRQLGLEAEVAMPGFVENPYGYMSKASVFVLSSRWEGLPTVLIEAMYAGAPVVATDCPSGPREILKDGAYGKLVPVGDADALAKAILSTLASKKQAPPAESWQPFELETIVNQYLDLFFSS